MKNKYMNYEDIHDDIEYQYKEDGTQESNEKWYQLTDKTAINKCNMQLKMTKE